MAGASETLTHPILGLLTWESSYRCWYAQHEAPGGETLFLQVEPAGDRYGFLKRAADLFVWALANERRVLREAVAAALLELYNDAWRQGEPVLSAEELKREMDWQGLSIRDGEGVLVEFGYDAGRLFGGHVVIVELDDELRFLDVDLRE